MKYPIVYLAGGYCGKTVLTYVCGHNKKNYVLVRSNTFTYATPSANPNLTKVQNLNGELVEVVKKNKVWNLDFEWKTGSEQYIIDDRVYAEKPNWNTDAVDLSPDQIYNLLLEHTDAHIWMIQLDDTSELFSKPYFRHCDFVIPYRKYGLVRQMIHLLAEHSKSIQYKWAVLRLDEHYRKIENRIKALKDLNLPYRFVDISDKDVYKNFGLVEDLEYDSDRRTFVTGDPKFEDLYDTNEHARRIIDQANQYVIDRKDYLTSLFPDIVL